MCIIFINDLPKNVENNYDYCMESLTMSCIIFLLCSVLPYIVRPSIQALDATREGYQALVDQQEMKIDTSNQAMQEAGEEILDYKSTKK